MSPDDFLRHVLSGHNVSAFENAAGTAASWELAAQAVICGSLQTTGGAAREIRYPDSKEAVDIAFARNGVVYLVELKVESASNEGKGIRFGGVALRAAFDADKTKLANFDVATFLKGSGLQPGRKWLLFLAYSATAKKQMKDSGLFSSQYTSGAIMAGLADV